VGIAVVVRLTLEADYLTRIEGEDAETMKSYFAAWGDRKNVVRREPWMRSA
jgi:hypothetical protein